MPMILTFARRLAQAVLMLPEVLHGELCSMSSERSDRQRQCHNVSHARAGGLGLFEGPLHCGVSRVFPSPPKHQI